MYSKRLIAVIHVISSDNSDDVEVRTLNEVKLAFDGGAHGIFLISGEHGITTDNILNCYKISRSHYPDKFIGINFLTNPVDTANLIPYDANALWVDYGIGTNENCDNISIVHDILVERNWKGQVFGGFYFKGNNSVMPNEEEDLSKSKKKVQNFIDVYTTSGVCTGVPIEIEILKKIYNVCDCVAVASGISCENISLLLPYVNYFIVGTGIEQTSTDPDIIDFYKSACLPEPVSVGHIDINKVKILADKISSYVASIDYV